MYIIKRFRLPLHLAREKFTSLQCGEEPRQTLSRPDALAEVPEDIVKELESDYLDPTLGVFQKEGKYYGVPMEFNLEYGE